MVNYKFESVQMLTSSVSELEVEQKLADIRMQLSEASLEMKSVDAVLDSVTLALDVIHNYKGEDDQIIDLINCGGAMERLLGVAEKDITVSASEEGLGNVLKTIWEKIKQFVAWLIQKIKDFGVWIGKKLGLVKDKVETNAKAFEEMPQEKQTAVEEACKKITVKTGEPGTLTAQQIREQLTGAFGGLKPDSKGTLRVAASLSLESYKVNQADLFSPRTFYDAATVEQIIKDLRQISDNVKTALKKNPFSSVNLDKILDGIYKEGIDYVSHLPGISRDLIEATMDREKMRKYLLKITTTTPSAVLHLFLSEEDLSLSFFTSIHPQEGTLARFGYRSAKEIAKFHRKLSDELRNFSRFQDSIRDATNGLNYLLNALDRKHMAASGETDDVKDYRDVTACLKGIAKYYLTILNVFTRAEREGPAVVNNIVETLEILLLVDNLTSGE